MTEKVSISAEEFALDAQTKTNLIGARVIARSSESIMAGVIQSVFLTDVSASYSSGERGPHTKITLQLEGGFKSTYRSTDTSASFVLQHPTQQL